jgi:hypothetical protein
MSETKALDMKLCTILVMAGIFVALGMLFLISRRQPESEPQAEPRKFIWSVEMEDMKHLTIILPAAGKSEAWVKNKDRYWYFDQPDGPKVNMKRWGGGIPLLLSGPGAERLITSEATDKQLDIYGFTNPKMKIALILRDENTINIEVGDRTLDGRTYYVKQLDSKAIYTVDHTWYDVLERLVLDPPYPEPDKH